MLQVEYPVDDADETADVLQEEDWQIYEKPAGKVLRFLRYTPLATESMRLTYTAGYGFDSSGAVTVEEPDMDAVEYLAASLFAEMLAAAHVLDQDATIDADSVDQKSRYDNYIKLSRIYRAKYLNHMGLKDGKPRPASAQADWDRNYPMGWDRLTHPRRRR